VKQLAKNTPILFFPNAPLRMIRENDDAGIVGSYGGFRSPTDLCGKWAGKTPRPRQVRKRQVNGDTKFTGAEIIFKKAQLC